MALEVAVEQESTEEALDKEERVLMSNEGHGSSASIVRELTDQHRRPSQR